MRRPRASLLPVLALTLLAAACTTQPAAAPGLSPSPAATAGTAAEPGTAGTAGTAGATAPTTSTGTGPFDCSAVSVAQQKLGEATHAELTRLGISADDVRAFPVVLVSGSQHAAEFWAAVRSAATPALDATSRGRLDKVAGYWEGLDGQLDAIEIPDSTETSLQAAQARLAELTAGRPPQDVTDQQRLQNLLRSSCGILPNVSTGSPS